MRITPIRRHYKRQREDDPRPRPTRTRTRNRRPTATSTSAETDEPTPTPTPRATRSSSTTSSRHTTTTRTTTTRSSAARASGSPSHASNSKGVVNTASIAHPTSTLLPEKGESGTTRAAMGIGLSIGAIAVLAVALWFLRKWMLKKQAAKHGAWRASLLEPKDDIAVTPSAPLAPKISEKENASLVADVRDMPSTPPLPAPPEPAGIPDTMRPVSMVPLAASTATATAFVPTLAIPSVAVSPAGVTSPTSAVISPVAASPVGARREAAMVVRTFVPTLSDELPVNLGDTVFINEAYSDGWASCTNSSGQCGVVPLECLQSMSRPPREQTLSQQDGATDYRTSQRHTSLYEGARASGVY